MKNFRKQLVLNKGSEKFIFRYDQGCEGLLLESIAQQAADDKTTFDWFDAAILSFKLAQSLMYEANRLIYKDMPAAMESFAADDVK